MKNKPVRNNFPLWLGFSLTAIWLLLFTIYGYRNFNDLISLQPNNLGDFLAGVFAPLAFLWLFVATLLQRQELELQRQELTETREVMSLQKEEMKRAADENSQQTKIMVENLKTVAEEQVYSEVETILYSLALFLITNWRHMHVHFKNGGIAYLINGADAKNLGRNDFEILYTSLRRSSEEMLESINNHSGSGFHLKQIGAESIVYVHDNLSQILAEEKYRSNKLAIAKLNGLQIAETHSIISHIRKALIQ